MITPPKPTPPCPCAPAPRAPSPAYAPRRDASRWRGCSRTGPAAALPSASPGATHNKF